MPQLEHIEAIEINMPITGEMYKPRKATIKALVGKLGINVLPFG
jgi:hypothetical protein